MSRRQFGILWMRDPKTGEPSFTYALAVIATLTMLASIGIELAGKAKGTSLVSEFFFGTLGAYVGRRFEFGNGSVSGPLEGEGDEKN